MAGHSKWKNIKHKKAAADALKAKRFTKLLKEITICARESGGELASNPTLRTLIEKAHEINMPKENYIRAIKRGTGEISGNHYEEVLYEGYGPGNFALLIHCLTDNKNRAASEIREFFQRNNGTLAEAGAVKWMFERKGLVDIKCNLKKINEESLVELLSDFDIFDIQTDDSQTHVICSTYALKSVEEKLKEEGYTIEEAEIGYYSKNKFEPADEFSEKIELFLEKLDELDDVQGIYTNLL